jgi:glycosyltransferase involved in cell wall biosynthesis
LSQTDIFVMPSLAEGFGNAMLEAMVAGLPVIASDIPVVRQNILRDEPAACLFPAGDVDALGRALVTLVSNAELRRDYGHRAAAVAERFQTARMVDEFAEMYERLLAWRTPA